MCKIGSPLLSFLLCSLCTPLQGLLNEQAGANIRNEIAHGITSEYMASSGAYLYFAGAVIKLLTYTSIKCYDLITTEGSKLKTFIEPGSDAIKIKRV